MRSGGHGGIARMDSLLDRRGSREVRLRTHMASIRVSKQKYDQLVRQAKSYRLFAARFFESLLRDSSEDVVEDFRKTNLYTEEFLGDLESGLRKSSYTKRRGTRAAPKGS